MDAEDAPPPERAIRNLCRLYGLRAYRRKNVWTVVRELDGKPLGHTTTDRTLASWIETFKVRRAEGVI